MKDHVKIPESTNTRKKSRRHLNWGPYLSERQWGTIREDRSSTHNCWQDLNFYNAHTTSFLTGEDGMFGISDPTCTLCFSTCFYNGKDCRVKERLFGLSNPQGNHGEDVKELYFYLTNTPQHNFMKARYIYPVSAFPYDELTKVNSIRARTEPEYEIWDTDELKNGWWEIDIVYGSKDHDDFICTITARNKSKETTSLWIIPTIWFRNSWSTLYFSGDSSNKPSISKSSEYSIVCQHSEFDDYYVTFGDKPRFIFTENENQLALENGKIDTGSQQHNGTKCYAVIERSGCLPGAEVVMQCRISHHKPKVRGRENLSALYLSVLSCERRAKHFYDKLLCWLPKDKADLRKILENAYSGLLWNKQYYEYNVADCNSIRRRHFGEDSTWNCLWDHFKVSAVLSVPDKWEFPWFATWDLCFHLIPLSDMDPEFCKGQMKLVLSDNFMSPDGQLPGCEFEFGDPNPPLQGIACSEIFKKTKDFHFLQSVYSPLLKSFDWWWQQRQFIESEDGPFAGGMFFEAGFLGLDNICVIDRSKPPGGCRVFQCDAFCWVFNLLLHCLDIAWLLRRDKEEVKRLLTQLAEMQQKFRHMYNGMGCDLLVRLDGHVIPLVIKSYVALSPLLAQRNFHEDAKGLFQIAKLIPNLQCSLTPRHGLAISLLTDEALEALLRIFVAPNALIGPYGVRSLSAEYAEAPWTIDLLDVEYKLGYVPGESDTFLFGGNSNWRGPVWICMNYLIIDSLHGLARSHPDLSFEYLDSGRSLSLEQIWRDLCLRILSIFELDKEGRRPLCGDVDLFGKLGPWNGPEYALFFEYFHGDTGRGCGANHQTGWTSLIASIAKLYFTDSRFHRTGLICNASNNSF